jgi:predicted neutral ceramidase superfamily lipid hydrolase
MKVDLLDHVNKVACTSREIHNVVGMTFHGVTIALGLYTIVVTCVKKGLVKTPFPNALGSKMKNMVKNVVMWWEKDVVLNSPFIAIYSK